MNFDLSENELMIQQMVKDFAEREIRPNVMKWDESQEFPVELFKKAGELGLMGVLIPQEYGGSGFGCVGGSGVGLMKQMTVSGSNPP